MERKESIAHFINNCINYDRKVIPITGTSTVKYLRTAGSMEWVADLIHSKDTYIISKYDYSPVKKLENILVRRGFSCDKNNTPDRLSIIKPVSTYLPRKYVIIFINDMNSEELFYACTMGTVGIVIIDDGRILQEHLPMKIDDRYVNNINSRARGTFKPKPNPKHKPKIPPKIKYKVLVPPQHNIKYIYNNEFVADITGLAVPMAYEYRVTGNIKFIDIIKKDNKFKYPITKLFFERFLLQADFSTFCDVLKLASMYLSLYDGYISRLKDIKDYSWLDDGSGEEMINVLSKYISKNAEFEVLLEDTDYRVDAIDDGIIWEFKCKKRLQHCDYIQCQKYSTKGVVKLLNILTGELIIMEDNKFHQSLDYTPMN